MVYEVHTCISAPPDAGMTRKPLVFAAGRAARLDKDVHKKECDYEEMAPDEVIYEVLDCTN